MAQQPLQNHHPTPLAANLGLVRPPFVYLSAIALGLVVHSFGRAALSRIL